MFPKARPQVEELQQRVMPSAMTGLDAAFATLQDFSLHITVPAQAEVRTHVQSVFGGVDMVSASRELQKMQKTEPPVSTAQADVVFAEMARARNQNAQDQWNARAMAEAMFTTHAQSKAAQDAAFAMFASGGFGGYEVESEPEPAPAVHVQDPHMPLRQRQPAQPAPVRPQQQPAQPPAAAPATPAAPAQNGGGENACSAPAPKKTPAAIVEAAVPAKNPSAWGRLKNWTKSWF